MSAVVNDLKGAVGLSTSALMHDLEQAWVRLKAEPSEGRTNVDWKEELRTRYKRMVTEEWFTDAHQGVSLGIDLRWLRLWAESRLRSLQRRNLERIRSLEDLRMSTTKQPVEVRLRALRRWDFENDLGGEGYCTVCFGSLDADPNPAPCTCPRCPRCSCETCREVGLHE